ncbi:MAG TPA: DUF4142 domain-containing protein [Cytophagaceae bacterium]|jgi:predicted outer membrane protein|nr:DUF4142 domain-containing protein [Cytophagaceae bacterium]
MKKIISFLSASMIAIACSLSIQSCEEKAKSHDSEKVAEDLNEKKFDTRESEKNAELVEHSVACSYAVIGLSRLAEEKASHKDVKEIARELEREHHKSLEELKAVAEKEGISIASGPSDKAEDKIKDLSEKDAKHFDKAWLSKAIEKHKKAISELEDALKDDKIHPLEKEWASKTLPGLRAHLDKLTAIDDAIKS